MRVGSGELTFEWVEDFAEIPHPESAVRGWAHHGITVTPRNTLITFHPGLPLVLELSLDGSLLNTWELAIAEGHGIALHNDGKDVHLWFSDIGTKNDPDQAYEYVPSSKGPQNVKTTLDGRVVLELFTPPSEAYGTGPYSPTEAAVYSSVDGGNDDMWIADGYGSYHVHRYDKHGNHLGSIDGSEGDTGTFDQPHAIWVDTRKPDPELYIADRSHHRIQVYDLEGSWKRSFGDDFMTLPGAFGALGDYLVVGDLGARVDILDENDKLAVRLGDNPGVMDRPGWPNDLDDSGASARTGALIEGVFNSPHGLTTDDAGNIYVTEWLIGGRYIKLARI